MKKETFNLPNILTLLRIVVIPLIVATFFFKGGFSAWLGGLMFVAAAITDYFDGYFARKLQLVSKFGRFLDPIADKVLVSSVLLMLAYKGGLAYFGIIPALIILCREILVSGLREFLAESNVSMPVSRLAKWKTAFQLISLPLLIVGDHGFYFNELGSGLLWFSAVLTMITGYDYLKSGFKYINN
ncbi:MAG: CDP-diacylglycerol--glycerol-3-phosphate 3-phosphatidyltransferase [Alphaproteobacteria bacterium ADurb.Bin438]|nr:MAG: CDP-diacylglycerol--glycerol-3-phosphate 3-phosphatidyltransferase [Alphaproteobacteria bacterium ADurb.Bin438]